MSNWPRYYDNKKSISFEITGLESLKPLFGSHSHERAG
jgi:hypothetical protein